MGVRDGANRTCIDGPYRRGVYLLRHWLDDGMDGRKLPADNILRRGDFLSFSY